MSNEEILQLGKDIAIVEQIIDTVTTTCVLCDDLGPPSESVREGVLKCPECGKKARVEVYGPEHSPWGLEEPHWGSGENDDEM